jgi:hypothetical protein
MPRRPLVLASVAALSLTLAVIASPRTVTPQISAASVSEPESEQGRGIEEERAEQAAATAERLEALAEAREAGTAGLTSPIENAPAAGWTGEQLVNPNTDDWEPAIAADPNAPFVYTLHTRYGEPKPCQGNCPSPLIVLRVSPDGGTTWRPETPLCICRGAKAQYDPEIEVVPNTGDVYAAWLNGGFNTVFSRSTDHGKTWSEPVKTYGNVSWTDKPFLATDATGKHVYVSWNGPSGGDLYVAQSLDFGATWSQSKVADTKRYYFAFGGVVAPDGTVTFSQSSFSYTGPGGDAEGQVQIHAITSKDRGVSWTNTVVDSVPVGEACDPAGGCTSDYYLGHPAIAADGRGALTIVYDGPTTDLGPQRIWSRRSTDGGLTWSPRVRLSATDKSAAFTAVAARGRGDVRTWYMQEDGGPDAWNTYYRRSRDGGITWSAPVKLSDATSGTAYKTAAGFLEPYGDYGEIAITNRGETVGIWGEGASWLGPGGVWFNRQT